MAAGRRFNPFSVERYGNIGNGIASRTWKGIRMDHKQKIVDSHGRHIHKLRVQLTDACNFRCFYCMPQMVKFLPSANLLNASELLAICSALVDLGIDEIRVSGGEPTLRKDFDQIIDGLSQLPLGKLGLTTNGFFLAEKLAVL